MARPTIHSVTNAVSDAVSTYIDSTIRSPLGDLRQAQPAPATTRFEAEQGASLLTTMAQSRRAVSPRCEFIAPVSDVRAHYLGSLDTASSYRYRNF